MTDDNRWVNATDASRALRVSRATLYAYVSRGYIRSEAVPGSSRDRRYARDDIERVRRRTEERRDPDKAAARALHWGVPVLESSLTLIAGGRLYYRGHDAVEVSRTRSIEEVASLLWTGRFDERLQIAVGPGQAIGMRDEHLSLTAGPHRTRGEHMPFIARAQALLALTAARDPLAFDLRPAGVALTGWRILTVLTSVASRSRMLPTVDRTLARAWKVRGRGVELLRAALILCADHELNVSAFTARCVASSASTPYGVVIAGLAALEGTRHGGASVRVEAMLNALRASRNIRHALGERLRRGEGIDGFGHPLYRDGDPRAAALLDRVRDAYPRSPELARVLAVADAAAGVVREKPTIDFALAAVARVLRLPPGSPLVLFALGRTIGWIGHAIEQYATGEIIRPRAKYVGKVPE
jgi:citrate synthase